MQTMAPSTLTYKRLMYLSQDATLITVQFLPHLDPDTGKSHTYTLVAGLGDADNGWF